MREILFDTSILVDHLRGFGPATKLIKRVEDGEIIAKVSMLTVVELFAGKDSAGDRRSMEIRQLLELFDKIPIDETIAVTGGEIRRDHGIGISDAIIAATALASHAEIYTGNLKDFGHVKGLDVKDPY